MEQSACFITGHRPARFKFKYNETYTLCKKIKRALTEQIKAHYERGICSFWVGGAMGVDTWAGKAVLELRERKQYREIKLYVAVPFPTLGETFDARKKRRYQRMLQEATGSVTVCPAYSPDAYKKRDYYMVDQCACGIAVYDNGRSIRSGTGMTANYAARKKALPITFIHPDTAAVSSFAP